MQLAKSGFGLFNILKKGAGVVGLLRSGLSLLGGPVGIAITGVTLLAEAGFKYYDNLKKRVLPATIDFGDKVSESTSKAVNAYEDLNTKVGAQLIYYYLTNKKITKKIAENMSSQYEKMGKTLQDGYQKSTDKSLKVLSDFYASNKDMSEEEKTATLKNIKDSNAKKHKEIFGYTKRIKKIWENAAKEHRDITEGERKEIEEITRKMNKNVETALSKSKEEQTIIAGKLKDNKTELSAKEAAATVKNSKNAKDKVVKNAEKQYKDVVKNADLEYYAKGSITKKQHDDTVNSAKSQKEKVVKQAEKTHKGVVSEAKLQAAGHVKEVDWETGEVLGEWDTFVVDMAGVVNKITGGINTVLEFMHIPTIPEWKPKGYSGNSEMQVAPGLAYAKGTDFHPGGKALVGEEGWEYAHTPGIGTYVVGMGGPQIWDLPRGTSVLPHAQSKDLAPAGLPGYAGGVGKILR